MQQLLAQTRVGRILLHIACLIHGGSTRHHFSGVLRELRKKTDLLDDIRIEMQRD